MKLRGLVARRKLSMRIISCFYVNSAISMIILLTLRGISCVPMAVRRMPGRESRNRVGQGITGQGRTSQGQGQGKTGIPRALC